MIIYRQLIMKLCENVRDYLSGKVLTDQYSLKGIGKELLLSPRTIEVHLNNVKNKTGYHTKNNLIRVYRDFF